MIHDTQVGSGDRTLLHSTGGVFSLDGLSLLESVVEVGLDEIGGFVYVGHIDDGQTEHGSIDVLGPSATRLAFLGGGIVEGC